LQPVVAGNKIIVKANAVMRKFTDFHFIKIILMYLTKLDHGVFNLQKTPEHF